MRKRVSLNFETTRVLSLWVTSTSLSVFDAGLGCVGLLEKRKGERDELSEQTYVADASRRKRGEPILDIDEAIELAGGVSRFQYISFAMIVLGMICGAFILYSIVYFTHVPPMLC